MPGVRLRHPTARSCRYTIVEGDRPYASPFICPPPANGGCGTVHVFKTHHLDLDATGAVIVNVPLYERLKPRLTADGFANVGLVKKPPPQRIGSAALVPDATLPAHRTE